MCNKGARVGFCFCLKVCLDHLFIQANRQQASMCNADAGCMQALKPSTLVVYMSGAELLQVV